MNPATLAIAAALAVSASNATAQAAATIPQQRVGEKAVWRWVGQLTNGTLVVDLVRANVRILRSDSDRIVFAATASAGADGSPVSLTAMPASGEMRIIDHYPASSRFDWSECLPPDGEHGGASSYQDTLAVTLIVPRRQMVRVKAMAGEVIGQ